MVKIENQELSELLKEQQSLFLRLNNKYSDDDKKRLKVVQLRISEIQKEYLNNNLKLIDKDKIRCSIEEMKEEQKKEVVIETELDIIKRELKIPNQEYKDAIIENKNIYKILLPQSRQRKINALNKIKELREKKKQIKNNVLNSSQGLDTDMKGEQSPSSI